MGPRQICHFLGGILASQRLISVREAAEPRNNLMMLACIAIFSMPPFDQDIFIAKRCAVHQRHVEKV